MGSHVSEGQPAWQYRQRVTCIYPTIQTALSIASTHRPKPNKSMNKTLAIVILLCVTLHIKTSLAQTNKITFRDPDIYPEGIAFDKKKNVAYVSSVKTGTIGAVDENGKYTEIYTDKGLKSTFGMKVDEK